MKTTNRPTDSVTQTYMQFQHRTTHADAKHTSTTTLTLTHSCTCSLAHSLSRSQSLTLTLGDSGGWWKEQRFDLWGRGFFWNRGPRPFTHPPVCPPQGGGTWGDPLLGGGVNVQVQKYSAVCAENKPPSGVPSRPAPRPPSQQT